MLAVRWVKWVEFPRSNKKERAAINTTAVNPQNPRKTKRKKNLEAAKINSNVQKRKVPVKVPAKVTNMKIEINDSPTIKDRQVGRQIEKGNVKDRQNLAKTFSASHPRRKVSLPRKSVHDIHPTKTWARQVERKNDIRQRRNASRRKTKRIVENPHQVKRQTRLQQKRGCQTTPTPTCPSTQTATSRKSFQSLTNQFSTLRTQSTFRCTTKSRPGARATPTKRK